MGRATEEEYCYWLSRSGVIGAVKAKKLLEYAGSFEAIYNMKKQELLRLPFLREGDAGWDGGSASGAGAQTKGIRSNEKERNPFCDAPGSGISETAAEYL